MGILIKSRRVISELLYKILCFIVAVFLIIFLTLFIILASPIYIFRLLTSAYAKRFRPDLGKILTTRSAITSVYNVYTKPMVNVIVEGVLEGEADIDKLINMFQTKIIEEIYDNGESVYPEFRQYLYKWMGFTFWKWDNKFDIRNHIKFETHHGICDRAKLDRIKEVLLIKPWAPYRSPWGFTLIPNFVESDSDKANPNWKPKSVFLGSFQHTLCDGFSFLKLFYKFNEMHEELERLKVLQSKPINSNFVIKALAYLKCPYDLVYSSIRSSNFAPWGLYPWEYSMKYITLTSDKIPIQRIKDIRNGNNVGFTGVLCAALTGGLRKAFETKSVKGRKINLPKNMYCVAALPMPGHPNKLRNHLAYGFLSFPVGESDPIRRLMKCHKSIQETKQSAAPLGMFLILPIVGGLFNFMIKIVAKHYIGAVNLSNFPGPSTQINVAEQTLIGLSFSYTIPPSPSGIIFGVITYLGSMQISIMADKALIKTKEDAKIILDAVLEEINVLFKDLIV